MSRRCPLTLADLRALGDAAAAVQRLYDAGVVNLAERASLLEQAWVDLANQRSVHSERAEHSAQHLLSLYTNPTASSTTPERNAS